MYQLDDLPGHTTLKSNLKKLVQTPPSTLLFKGPSGVGKARYARAFAHALLAEEKTRHKLESGNHPDLREIYPEGKTLMHPMQAIKQLIEDALSPPFEGRYKVFIIHDADRMLPSSSNALLKTLEEPQDHIIFILISSHPELLLPTIASRAFEVAFSHLTDRDLGDYIQKKWDKTPEEARQIAWIAQGSLIKADSIAEKKDYPLLALASKIGTHALWRNYPALFRALSELDKTIDKEVSAEEALSAIYSWFRDLHLLKAGGDTSFLFFRSHESSLKKCLGCTIPKLQELKERMQRVQEARECNISFRNCLTYLLV